jgi:hypothetical protein
MEEIIERVKGLIDLCWDSFSAKVGNGLVEVNKEASMQLQFAYLLNSVIALSEYSPDEVVTIELETGVSVGGRIRECDIVIRIRKGDEFRFLPIELKCYKYLASSGNKRGAVDIFYKDVYADLELLEAYANVPSFLPGIQLTMTDFRNIPYPPKMTGKYIDYNITQGATIRGGIHLTTPIGGKDVDIRLSGSYDFRWEQVGQYYFLKLVNLAD